MIRVKQDLGGQSPGEGLEVGTVLASLKNYTKVSANLYNRPFQNGILKTMATGFSNDSIDQQFGLQLCQVVLCLGLGWVHSHV